MLREHERRIDTRTSLCDLPSISPVPSSPLNAQHSRPSHAHHRCCHLPPFALLLRITRSISSFLLCKLALQHDEPAPGEGEGRGR
eukprot:3474714-Rhodomonas_salina.1